MNTALVIAQRLGALSTLRLKEQACLDAALKDWTDALDQVKEAERSHNRYAEQCSSIVAQQVRHSRQGALVQPHLLASLRQQAEAAQALLALHEQALREARTAQEATRTKVAQIQAGIDAFDRHIERERRCLRAERERRASAELDDLWLARSQYLESEHA